MISNKYLYAIGLATVTIIGSPIAHGEEPQTTTQQNTTQKASDPAHFCYYEGKQYSPGAILRIGNTNITCKSRDIYSDQAYWQN